jgi:hypothetical protein
MPNIATLRAAAKNEVLQLAESAIPVKFIPAVTHLGELDLKARPPSDARNSYEGGCISVSIHPEAWDRIAKLGDAQPWKLTLADAAYLDIHALNNLQIMEATSWAEENELGERQTAWKAWFYDSEVYEWRYMLCATEEEAAQNADDSGDMPPHLENIGLDQPVEQANVWTLTAKGAARAAVRHHTLDDSLDHLISFWAEDVIRAKLPNLVGVWWNELYEPDNLSAPRGGIFPSSIASKQLNISPGYATYPEDEEDLIAPPTFMIDAGAMESGYRFVTNCVQADGYEIAAMTDSPGSNEIDYAEFVAKLGNGRDAVGQKLIDQILPYGDDMRIDQDWHVRYNESSYRGLPCLYIVHSAIEYVFQRDGLLKAAQYVDPRSEMQSDPDDGDTERSPSFR